MRQNSIILRTNSVKSPTAQFNTLLQPGAEPMAGYPGQVSVLESNKGLLGVYYYLFVLMQSSGCRVGEILGATCQQISSHGKLLIKGLKGSNDRFIHDARAAAFLLECKAIDRNPFHGCNRFTARRHLQKISLFTQKKGRKNLTVTGVFREEFAKEIREIDNSDSAVSKHIGHKVSTNGKHYGKG